MLATASRRVIHSKPVPSSHTMSVDLRRPCSSYHEPCYFSILPATHFSLETPSTSPFLDYTPAEPSNPLLALRLAPPLHMSGSSDASRLLQLQTAAAHRPSAEPLQQRASSTSSTGSSASSSSSTVSSSSISCVRCRRDCLAGMYQIGTNRYYCSHCARMTGYSAG